MEHPDPKATTIILAEDDAVMNMIIEKKLRQRGHKVIPFFSGKEICGYAGKNDADLMILDYNLQDMNAQEVIEEIVIKQGTRTPFMIMTGLGDEKTAVTMMKLGAKDYIIKEKDFLELLSMVVERILRSVESEKKLKTTTQALSSSQERFRLIWELNEVGMVLIDSEQETIIDINQKGSTLLGIPMEKAVGFLCKDLFYRSGSGETRHAKWKNKEQAESILYSADGTVKEILRSVVSIELDSKSAVLVSFMDVSDKKKEEKAKETALEFALQKESETAGLLAATRAVLQGKYFHQSAFEIMEICKGLTGSETGKIYLLNDHGELKKAHLQGRDWEQGSAEIAGDHGWADILMEALSKKKPLCQKLDDAGYLMALPLVLEPKTMGVLELRRSSAAYLDDMINLATAFAELLSISLWNSRTRESLILSERNARVVNERLTNAMNAGGLAWWTMDVVNGNVEFADNKLKMIGYNPAEFSDVDYNVFMGMVHPDDYENTMKAMRDHLDGKVSLYEVDYRIRKKDGGYAWFHDRGSISARSADGTPRFVTGVAIDISVRKFVEESLRHNELRMKKILEIMQFQTDSIQDFLDNALSKAVELTDSKLGYIYFYNEESRLFTLNSWSKDVMKECSITQPQTEYALERTGIWGESVRQRRPIIINDYAAPNPLKKGCPEGHASLKRFMTLPVFSHEKIVAVIGLANKLTEYTDGDIDQISILMESVWGIVENRKFQLQLMESERNFKDFFENEPSYCFIIDNEGNINDINLAVMKGLGFDKATLVGKNIGIIDAAVPGTKILSLISGRSRIDGIDNMEVEILTVKSEKKTVLLSAADVGGHGEKNQKTIVTMRDITELRKTELWLQQSQKLESIGQLAAGIAHEINTPTQYIGDNMVFLKESMGKLKEYMLECERFLGRVNLGSDIPGMKKFAKAERDKADLDYLLEEIPRAIDETLEGAQKVATIVRSMKEFSHPGSEMTSIDITKAIESTVVISRNVWKYSATVAMEMEPNLPSVQCIPGEINQTLLNLIVNACHAIEDVRKVPDAPLGKITLRAFQEGEKMVITVSDTGVGIPENIRSRIFDPFFTTKGIGRGTGQGLYLVHKTIVQTHRGTIDVESTVGVGTTFILKIPVLHPEEGLPS